ncbi:hypothetical protein G0Q06_03060 [Puniceicoccales bacterium CK1056]|uniref:Uncharacterized protein n=1 Tax=Oceanipulchritudo coccoides TaxID=2706888 RepID=A0A6B2LZ30_9BACT|nr:hypothetical protein [Oceanipulchritudo coccoides]NDV61422.1 hypothetical protein [Oceanipulchritudo coccoides]
MNKWIAKQFIAFSEITGRPVPRLVHKLVSREVLEEESKKEHQFTEALRGEGRRESIPSSLVDQLDQTLGKQEVSAARQPTENKLIFPLWATAAAAVLLVSLTIFMPDPFEEDEQTPVLVESIQTVETPPAEVAVSPVETNLPGLLLQSVKRDLVVQPMLREQERLAADMTNAIQYMADSFLPDRYAERVNENLRSLKDGVTKSI